MDSNFPDYSKSKVLDSFEWLGVKFLIVRQKFRDNKTWRGYTALLTEDRVCVVTTTSSNLLLNAENSLARMQRVFPDEAHKEGMLDLIEQFRKRGGVRT